MVVPGLYYPFLTFLCYSGPVSEREYPAIQRPEHSRQQDPSSADPDPAYSSFDNVWIEQDRQLSEYRDLKPDVPAERYEHSPWGEMLRYINERFVYLAHPYSRNRQADVELLRMKEFIIDRIHQGAIDSRITTDGDVSPSDSAADLERDE